MRPRRADNPKHVMQHANRYKGGKALIVLGGYSGAGWRDLVQELKPDVLLGGNGVNQMIDNLDYWMCAENMNFSNGAAARGDPRAVAFMEMFYRNSGAKVKLISHWSWNLLHDKKDCISIMRNQGFGRGVVPENFSLREYGDGLLNGWIFKHEEAISMATRVGTVGAQLLHMAGILGCAEVHTIGLDLLQRDDNSHHWYPYPVYRIDRFRRAGMFVEYKGVQTQLIWIETAQFLKSMQPYFERDGLKWVDHSQGLLQIEGLECAA